MNNIIIIFILLFGIMSILLPDLISLWIIREVINLLAIYSLLTKHKESSASDVIQYIFILFVISLLLILGIIIRINSLIFLRLWGKLGLAPLHQPVINIATKLRNKLVLTFFILPKIPYLVIRSCLPTTFFLFPIIILMLIARKFSSNEPVGITLIISTLAIAIVFTLSITVRFFIFIGTIIWRVFLKQLDITTNLVNQTRYSYNTLLTLFPVPRSYSWIVKAYLLQYASFSFLILMFLIIISALPMWYILLVRIKPSRNTVISHKLYHISKFVVVWGVIILFILAY